MTSRYVVVRSLDGIEAIVPNETLVTTTVLNHSYTSKDMRLGDPGAGELRQRRRPRAAAHGGGGAAEPRVKRAPNAPAAFVVRFADSGIDLELGVWISDPENGQGDLRSSLNRTILRSFNANGIRIPYPQRELRILNVSGPEATPVPGDPTQPGSPA